MTRDEAQLYALVHDGSPGDLAFYVRFCGEGRTVLELGVGTGRVARALADEGFDVTGVECDAGMLAEARAHPHESVTLVEGDMRDLNLGATFDRIILPFTGLYCLPDEDALDRCLTGVRRHLAPGGLFAFDVYAADGFHEEARPEDYPDDQMDHVTDIEHGGERLAVFESSSWDRDAQTMLARYTYRREDGTTRASIPIHHRYVLRDQLSAALETAGLASLGVFGSFDGAPYDRDSASMIVMAERAS
ncbi:MAG: class I SAM-dependent methyltransferase [Sandaracinaceae bacterium]